MQINWTSARAHPNIAFIKYWGNRDEALRLPLNGSLSMSLNGLATTTRVAFAPGLEADSFTLNGVAQEGEPLERVSRFLDVVRSMARTVLPAQVESSNNFPAGAGIASSASAFAALAAAASRAAGLQLSERELSRLARLGSGSACRSVPAGFVEWLPGTQDADSYAVSIAEPAHWQLLDLIVILDRGHKQVGSSAGHALAGTSPLNALRQQGVQARLDACREAILRKDFAQLAGAVEADSHWMHAVMRTSQPPLIYWTPATEIVLWNVLAWRNAGHAVCATVDAGPNVHVITVAEESAWARGELQSLPGVLEIIEARPGGGVELLD